jgi:hypothetical protein
MAETRKEKGIKQLTQMLTRWENWDDEFRQYIAWRMDSLKMLGAGNTSGILAVAVFLTTGNSKAGWMLGVAKVCLILFFIGFGGFFFAYRTLYRCANHMEDGLLAMRAGGDVENKGVKESISEAIDFSEKSGVFVLVSTYCFAIGSVIAFIGLLFG